ncbi:hypothetical protein FW774_14005 [Pedobacter sp. BS3]|uniref:LamG domain-containing protein n=1 Tax=Pedobacter sp. BS3 TaxID=2567937 RepID=UPI0011ED8DF4|nr:LamG domain-containing protein [Pedobacter sp. BS3]TZF82616.1 hypothetical protein FW774_14005 [Pedobacter sp. BS3]
MNIKSFSKVIIGALSVALLYTGCNKDDVPSKKSDRLASLISEATELAANATEGPDPGVYPVGSIGQLQAMIDSAKTLEQKSQTQYGIDLAEILLQKAITQFKGSIQVEKQLYFDGTGYLDGGIVTPYIVPNFTLQAWVYPTEWKNAMYVISTEGSGNGYKLQVPNGKLTFQINGTANQLAAPDANKISLNEWAHIAASYDGAVMKIYVNGVMVAQKNYAVALVGNTQNFRIGEGSAFAGRTFKGRIKGVGVWSKALSDTEVAAQMQNAPTGTESGLIAYWPFNLSSGTTIWDRTGSHALNIINVQYVDPL